MFSQTESFERCPDCKNPYFEKKTLYIVDKVNDRHKHTPVLVTKEITSFVCSKCSYVMSEFTNESALDNYE